MNFKSRFFHNSSQRHSLADYISQSIQIIQLTPPSASLIPSCTCPGHTHDSQCASRSGVITRLVTKVTWRIWDYGIFLVHPLYTESCGRLHVRPIRPGPKDQLMISSLTDGESVSTLPQVNTALRMFLCMPIANC